MASEQEQISEFCLRFNLPIEAAEFLEGLPGEVLTKVLSSFNPKGSKDGNVFPRLEAFANSILFPGGRGRGGSSTWPEQASPLCFSAPRHPGPAPGFASMQQYCASVGLDGESASLLQLLPQDMQETIMSDFDPHGTKDGNVFGRVIGFARSLWTHRLGLNREVGREATVYLRELPEGVQIRVMAFFDPTRSGGGPLVARLQRFAADLSHQRAGAGAGGRPAGADGRPAGATSQSAGGGRWDAQAPQQTQWRRRSGATSLDDFAHMIGLDAEAYAFLQALPDDVQAPIFSGFDPSGTKDGNVWGRLFGFARSVWSHKLGLDTSTVSFMKGLPEDVQRVVMMKFDPSLSKDGNIAARLEGFARSVAARGAYGKGGAGDAGGRSKGGPPPWQHKAPNPSPQQSFGGGARYPLRAFVERWNLNAEASEFIGALPEDVILAVCQSFTATGTKDGNVWGRLFGFVRSVWQRQLNISGEAFGFLRSLSEDAQRAAMMRFDPAAAGNALAELRAIHEHYPAEVSSGNAGGGAVPWRESGGAGGGAAPWREQPQDDDVLEFARRFGLDEGGVAFLRGLGPEVLSTVLSDFNAGGTKDGNVFGRLQGFANSVTSRKRRRGGGFDGRSVRPRGGL